MKSCRRGFRGNGSFPVSAKVVRCPVVAFRNSHGSLGGNLVNCPTTINCSKVHSATLKFGPIYGRCIVLALNSCCTGRFRPLNFEPWNNSKAETSAVDYSGDEGGLGWIYLFWIFIFRSSCICRANLHSNCAPALSLSTFVSFSHFYCLSLTPNLNKMDRLLIHLL